MQKQTVIPDKVQELGNKKFKVEKHSPSEIDATIEIVEDGTYVVEKLSADKLPEHMDDNQRTRIRWFNNFVITENGQPIKKHYYVTIAGLSSCNVVILDSSNNEVPYYYKGTVNNDTIVLTNGDPSLGGAP